MGEAAAARSAGAARESLGKSPLAIGSNRQNFPEKFVVFPLQNHFGVAIVGFRSDWSRSPGHLLAGCNDSQLSFLCCRDFLALQTRAISCWFAGVETHFRIAALRAGFGSSRFPSVCNTRTLRLPRGPGV
jgi:hypothetical protein